jgi:hypothetical protein
MRQFFLRLDNIPGLPSEIAAALWQNGVHIKSFFAELHERQQIFRLTVDKAAIAKRTFIENGWKPSEDRESRRPL